MANHLVRCPNCDRTNRVPAAASGVPRCGNCHQPLPWIVEATDDSFAEIAEQSSLPVVVDFWAPWCGPCRMVSPALAQVAEQLAGRIKLVKVNVDNSPRLQQRFSIQAIPTLQIIRDGKVAAQRAGAAPAADLRAWVEQAIPVKS
ncbi:MAG TPA: thioredoxin [Streptosporangiaceae bacterium]|jgi:thioredoxin 2|nr:thioredoxin [Streptosporangiaceae bacterium]